jgi:hypothetical protein
MVETKKGVAKITIEVEINEGLMEVVTESMKNIPEMMKMMPVPGQKKE